MVELKDIISKNQKGRGARIHFSLSGIRKQDENAP